MTLNENVTTHRENREIELGRNQEDRENAVKSMVSAIGKSPTFSPVFAPVFKNGPDFKIGKKNGKTFGKTHYKAKGCYEMRKLHYKGRCTKRRLSKCKDICRTYDKIQTSFADWLQGNDGIVSFQCNDKIESNSEDQYTSDFCAEKKDGSVMVRECVWRKNLSRPTTAKLLDISRNY